MGVADFTLTMPRPAVLCLVLALTVTTSAHASANDVDSSSGTGNSNAETTGVIHPTVSPPGQNQDSAITPVLPPPAMEPGQDTPTGDSPEQPIPLTVRSGTGISSAGSKDGDQPRTETISAPSGGLLDRKVLGADHASLGRVVDVLAGPDGKVRAVVVDIGGFLGVGNRRVAIAWSLLAPDQTDSGRPITVLAPSGVIRSAPEYNNNSPTIQILSGPHVTQPPADEGNSKRPDDENAQPDSPAIAVPLTRTAAPSDSVEQTSSGPGSPQKGSPQKEEATPRDIPAGPPASDHGR
ncbi:hypothetical protein GOB93_06705 [Acetobacter musti]|uniref:PRC-barrel domain-containing protein n=1 Tax=Acetobacter musti TaxID=864732 RepID=A0ABX0JPB5_9PROT|nr:PRC-barrel domain-containing protein [Acetobacter musti]NHN84336.1 hypothetical protein [Acetobacter musti]